MAPPHLLSQAEREILNFSKARFQLHMIHTNNLIIDSIDVRAAVLRPGSESENDHHDDDDSIINNPAESDRPPRFLMLRRAGADRLYELPGGDVAEDNDSIGEALGRHVERVTGLKVRTVLGRLGDVTTPSERGDTPASRASVQVSYVVDVEGVPADGNVTSLDRDVHSEAVWVDLDLLKKLPMADETHSLVEQALEVWDAPG